MFFSGRMGLWPSLGSARRRAWPTPALLPSKTQECLGGGAGPAPHFHQTMYLAHPLHNTAGTDRHQSLQCDREHGM